MDFRAPGQSNERRRRVRADDSAAATLPIRPQARSDDAGAREKSGRRYADNGRPDRQPRLMDLVPLRRLWQNAIAICGVLVVAGLLAGHWATHRAAATLPEELVRSLDVRANDSLAAWTRACILAATAAMAILVYVVRRHRADDYRGGYRVWLWAAAGMLMMSADAVAGLREAVRGVCVAETGWSGPGNGFVWWAGPCAIVALTLGTRLVLDMRECRVSTWWLCVAALAWTIGEALGAIGFVFADALTSDLAAAGLSILGQWCLLVSMNWHARHVVLDASGALRSRRKKKTRRKLQSRRSPSRRSASLDAEPSAAANTATAKRREARESTASTASASTSSTARPAASNNQSNLAAKLTFGGRAAHDAQPDSNQLSKAERKKLKREMRRAA